MTLWMVRTTRWRRPWRSVNSVKIISLLSLLACILLLLLHLDCAMNHGIVTHIEAVKHLNVPLIKTAHHIPALIEEHSS